MSWTQYKTLKDFFYDDRILFIEAELTMERDDNYQENHDVTKVDVDTTLTKLVAVYDLATGEDLTEQYKDDAVLKRAVEED